MFYQKTTSDVTRNRFPGLALAAYDLRKDADMHRHHVALSFCRDILGETMASNDNEVQIGAQGRMVIPAALRKALNLNQGDRLIARKVAESLVLERRESVERRLRERFKHIPQDISLSDELIAERRTAAKQEASLS